MTINKHRATRFANHNDASFDVLHIDRRIVGHRLRRTFALLLRPVAVASLVASATDAEGNGSSMRIRSARQGIGALIAAALLLGFTTSAQAQTLEANAGNDQTVNEGVRVDLDGSGSTSDLTGALEYYWVALDSGTLLNPSTGMATDSTVSSPYFIAPVGLAEDSVLQFKLTVQNTASTDSSPDTVNVTVLAAPVAEAGRDTTVLEGATMVTLRGSGTESDGITALSSPTYTWTAPEGIDLSSTTAAEPTFDAPTGLEQDLELKFWLTVNDGVQNSAADSAVVTVSAAPLAEAGRDTTVAEGATAVTLRGLGSKRTANTAANATVVTYAWTAPTGITLSSTTAAEPTFDAPAGFTMSDSVLTFWLTVNDGLQDSAADSAVVTVNVAPVANAGNDQTVVEGAAVTLNGSQSYDNSVPEDALTYTWNSDDASALLLLSSTSQVQPTFMAPAGLQEDSVMVFRLTVNDELQDSAEDTVNVTVYAAPVAEAGRDTTVLEGATMVTLRGSGTESDGTTPLSIPTYTWTAPEGIDLSSTTAAEPTFTAPTGLEQDLELKFWLTVNDGVQNSAADSAVVTVSAAPLAEAGRDTTVAEGATAVTLRGLGSKRTANTAANATVTYAWTAPTGITLSSTTAAEPTFDAPAGFTMSDSVLTFWLTVNDGLQNSAADSAVVTVNVAPVANAGVDTTVAEGSTVTLNGSQSYDNSVPEDALTYAWISRDGITLSNAAAQNPTFTAPDEFEEDLMTLVFSLTVNDGRQDSEEDIVVVTVKPAPVADAGPDQTAVAEGATVTLDGSGSTNNLNSDPLEYTWESSDNNISLDSTTTMTTTFTAPTGLEEDLELTFTLTVNDGVNASEEDIVLVTVKPAPVADAGPDQTAVAEGATVTLDGGASTNNLNSDPLEYTWDSRSTLLDSTTTTTTTFTAPTGLQEDSVVTVWLTVSDGVNESAADTVLVTVKPAPGADAGPDQTVAEGATVTLDGSNSMNNLSDALVAFDWDFPEGITLIPGNTVAMPTFEAPTGLLKDSVLTFTLTVNDGVNDSEADIVLVTVSKDKAVLLALYDSTNGGDWERSDNWGTNAALDTWFGVSTDDAGRVDSLSLHENSLEGAIPAMLGDLTNLEILDLQDNRLTGSIPADLGDLTNLEELYLHENSLSGSIPADLGDLTSLKYLILRLNSLSGSIPAELGKLTNLERLRIEDNSLTGSIPAALGDLTNLTHLDLHSNDLTGPIPAELGKLTNLERLRLEDNSLTGSIPAELGYLTNLQRLWLHNNDLTGSIPAALSNLSNLTHLDVDNGLCVPGDTAFQEWLGDLVEFSGDSDNICIVAVPAVRSRILRVGGGPVTIDLDKEYPYDLGADWSIRHYRVGDDDPVNNPGHSFTVDSYANVVLTGNELTLDPISVGAFELAVDPDASAEDDEKLMLVEVMSADAPVLIGEDIAVGEEYNDQVQSYTDPVMLTTREVEKMSKTLELRDYFYDPNHVSLTYEASADKVGAGDDAVDIVTATVSGSKLTIALTDQAQGGESTNVWVTATDGAGEYARLQVVVAVSGTTGPYVVAPLADWTLREDDDTDTTIGDLGDGFADDDLGGRSLELTIDIDDDTAIKVGDGDRFTWVTSSMRAAVDLAAETLTILPRGSGTSTFTVTATDKGEPTYVCPAGYATNDNPVTATSDCTKDGEPDEIAKAGYPDAQSISDSFTVTIVSETTPAVAQAIPDQELDADGDAATVDLADLNGDEDGEPAAFGDPAMSGLTYTASSADSTVVEVAVQGSVITLTPVWRTDEASTDVTVVATNASEEAISQSFDVTVHGATFPVVRTVIEDITLNTGDPATVLDLRNLSGGKEADPAFLDPNARAGDALPGGLLYEMDVSADHISPSSTATYVITSAMELTLDPSEATLTILPLGHNSAQVTLTATDREKEEVSQTFTVDVISVTGTEDEELPTEVELSRNYPNPFNPQTTIDYALPQAGDVSLIVYDMLGREVEVLVDGPKTAGRHTVRFGANDLPNGVYVYRLAAGEKTIVRTMVLVK